MKFFFLLMIPFLCWAMAYDHHHESMWMHGIYGTYPMQRDATGTSWALASTQMPGIHRSPDQWLLRVHGFLMAIYDDQGGPLGREKFFSENMFMFTAQKDFGNNTFALRNMISIEPATIGCNGYPLLLQTGKPATGHFL